MGLQALLMCSHTFYQDLMCSSKDCLARSEKCELFSSIEQEQIFLNQLDIEKYAKEYHQKVVNTINKDDMMVGLNVDISFN